MEKLNSKGLLAEGNTFDILSEKVTSMYNKFKQNAGKVAKKVWGSPGMAYATAGIGGVALATIPNIGKSDNYNNIDKQVLDIVGVHAKAPTSNKIDAPNVFNEANGTNGLPDGGNPSKGQCDCEDGAFNAVGERNVTIKGVEYKFHAWDGTLKQRVVGTGVDGQPQITPNSTLDLDEVLHFKTDGVTTTYNILMADGFTFNSTTNKITAGDNPQHLHVQRVSTRASDKCISSMTILIDYRNANITDTSTTSGGNTTINNYYGSGDDDNNKSSKKPKKPCERTIKRGNVICTHDDGGALGVSVLGGFDKNFIDDNTFGENDFVSGLKEYSISPRIGASLTDNTALGKGRIVYTIGIHGDVPLFTEYVVLDNTREFDPNGAVNDISFLATGKTYRLGVNTGFSIGLGDASDGETPFAIYTGLNAALNLYNINVGESTSNLTDLKTGVNTFQSDPNGEKLLGVKTTLNGEIGIDVNLGNLTMRLGGEFPLFFGNPTGNAPYNTPQQSSPYLAPGQSVPDPSGISVMKNEDIIKNFVPGPSIMPKITILYNFNRDGE